MKLYAPKEYQDATPDQRNAVSNGCGSKGLGGWFVPDTLWGLSITESCDIHDWMYAYGKTEEAKSRADKKFLDNMYIIIADTDGFMSKVLHFPRRRRALKYYYAVALWGKKAFWAGKLEPKKEV